jgi:hypothetical protein
MHGRRAPMKTSAQEKSSKDDREIGVAAVTIEIRLNHIRFD